MDKEWLKNNEIAQYLGVSIATISNWKREGLIPQHVSLSDLKAIRKNLNNKRKARANKTQSHKNFIPAEYLQSGVTETEVIGLLQMLAKVRGLRNKITLCAQLLLRQNGELYLSDDGKYCFKRSVVSKLMTDFCPRSWRLEDFTRSFEALKISTHPDILGLLYQSLKKEGDKAGDGSYYTPEFIVENLLSSVEKIPCNALDPCCGSGSFLMGMARKFGLKMDKLFGIDVDEIAVFITRFNLLMLFPEEQVMPKIFAGNALNRYFQFDDEIELIVSNPPWGAGKNDKTNRQYVDALASSESFSMFILHSLSLLKPKGELVFLLPESFLNIRNHRKIRQIVLKDNTLTAVSVLGRPFENVLSKVIKIVVRKGVEEKAKVKICLEQGIEYQVLADEFIQNEDFIIDIYANEKDRVLLAKIDAVQHFTLQGHSRWALGIVTGNNSRFISDKPMKGYEKVFRGGDVSVMRLQKCSTYIRYDRKAFQQVASDALFRTKEKLVYKFISNRLVFAYDDSKSLTLNSANILIPDFDGYDIKLIAAFLNSEVLQFVFQKRFATHKVLQSDLMTLPFPKLDELQKHDLMDTLALFLDEKTKFRSVDEKIYSAFGLDEDEKTFIHAAVSK